MTTITKEQLINLIDEHATATYRQAQAEKHWDNPQEIEDARKRTHDTYRAVLDAVFDLDLPRR